MSNHPLILGEFIYHDFNGDRCSMPVIAAEQRRHSRDGKMILNVVHCPHCGQYHEHGEVGPFLGFETRQANCPSRGKDNSYFIIQSDEPPVPASTPRPKLASDQRRRRL